MWCVVCGVALSIVCGCFVYVLLCHMFMDIALFALRVCGLLVYGVDVICVLSGSMCFVLSCCVSVLCVLFVLLFVVCCVFWCVFVVCDVCLSQLVFLFVFCLVVLSRVVLNCVVCYVIMWDVSPCA